MLARLLLVLGLSAGLGACSVSGLWSDWALPEAAGPEPTYRYIIATHIKEVVGDPAQSGVRTVCSKMLAPVRMPAESTKSQRTISPARFMDRFNSVVARFVKLSDEQGHQALGGSAGSFPIKLPSSGSRSE